MLSKVLNTIKRCYIKDVLCEFFKSSFPCNWSSCSLWRHLYVTCSTCGMVFLSPHIVSVFTARVFFVTCKAVTHSTFLKLRKRQHSLCSEKYRNWHNTNKVVCHEILNSKLDPVFTIVQVICQKRGRVLYHGFQILRNRWKHEAAGRVLSSVSRYLEPVIKHEARVFDMSSQMKQ